MLNYPQSRREGGGHLKNNNDNDDGKNEKIFAEKVVERKLSEKNVFVLPLNELPWPSPR